jgi:hypothetical protein
VTFARQPALGLAGLFLVLPVALLLGVAAGAEEPSLLVLGPLSTFALPVVAMIAFWWEDWPGSRLRPGWSGLADTLLVVVAALVLTMAGQLVVGRLDLQGIFDPTPGPGHSPTFPATMPLAAAAFVVMLQVTLVMEGWPLRGLGRFTSGGAALAVSWAIAIALYLLLVDFDAPAGAGLHDRSGPLSGGELAALLVSIGVWQVCFYVALRGWPFGGIETRWVRLLSANAVVLAGGLVTYFALHDLAGFEPATIGAAGGAFIAAGLAAGLLYDGWAEDLFGPTRGRAVTLASVVVVAAALYVLLMAYAHSIQWTRVEAEDWVAYIGLNAIGLGVILHVAIGHRWPFSEPPPRSP